jgi:hypothetical protein
MNDCGNAEMRDQLPDLLHGRLDESAYAVVTAHIETCVDCHEELELLRAVLSMAHARTPKIDIAAIVRALPTPSQIAIVAETVSVSDVPASHSPVMVESVMTPAGAATPVAAAAKVIVEPKVVPIASRRRVWSDWRVAAAVTLLVAGGSSAVLLKRGPNVDRTSIPITRTAVLSQRAADSAPVAANSASSSVAGASVAANAGSATPATVADADDRANTDLGNGNRLGDLDEQQLQTLLNKIDNLPAVPVTEPEPVSLHVNSQSSSEGA